MQPLTHNFSAMTKVKFFNGSQLSGFEVSGHTGLEEEGKDILCASVSSATLMTANTITEIIGDKADIQSNGGYLKVVVDSPSKETVLLLKGLQLHLKEISKQFPENITIINGGN